MKKIGEGSDIKTMRCKKCRMWTEHKKSGMAHPRVQCLRCKKIIYLEEVYKNE